MAEGKPYGMALLIGHGGKGIPYGGMHGELRPDGTSNHGFKDIKSDLSLLDKVPELEDDAALRELIAAINQPETGLFSVGCAHWPIEEGGRYRVSGYVEFVLNSQELFADARNYFPIFFHFDRLLHENSFDQPVNFNWVLEGATFIYPRVDGFTATVWVNTGYADTKEGADAIWAEALGPLTNYLASIPISPGATPIPCGPLDDEGPPPGMHQPPV